MFDLVLGVVKQLRPHPKYYVALELLRTMVLWKKPFPSFKCLLQLLPFVADFDGCQLGLVNKRGETVQKKWRIVTDHFGLSQGMHGRLCRRGG